MKKIKDPVSGFVSGLKEDQVRKILIELIFKLDEADLDDLLGTEGWRHYFSMEKKIPDTR